MATKAEYLKGGGQLVGSILSDVQTYKTLGEDIRTQAFSADQARMQAKEVMRRLEINKSVRESQGLQQRTNAVIASASSGFAASEYSSAALGASIKSQLADVGVMTQEAEYKKSLLEQQAVEYDRAAAAAKKAQSAGLMGTALGVGGAIAGGIYGGPMGAAAGYQIGSGTGTILGSM